MKLFKNFLFFIKELYISDNLPPLYHFTSHYTLNNILRTNILNVGYYENPLNSKKIKFVSLTRNKFFKDYRNSNVRIELDKNKLSNNYKIIPYDYFIHSKIEKYPKWNTNRKEKYEFEEIILKDITNLNLFILSLDFNNIEYYYKSEYDISLYNKKYNLDILITIKGKKINDNV